jgi:hypothetical protein
MKISFFWAQSVESQPTFQRGQAVRKASKLVAWFMLVSSLVYSSNLMMEATRSSETSDDSERTAWYYIPDGKTLFFHVF